MDFASVQPVVDTLRNYLADDDPEAMEYFLEQRDQLLQAIPAANLREWENKLHKFDFEALLEDMDRYRC
jgi:hypothetical protein